MQWPSQRVPQGGIFQPPKVRYSAETKDFLKVLMEESKLTAMQRKQVDNSLRSGKPLPRFEDMHSPLPHRSLKEKVVVRPGSSKRRMFSTIVQSGAYEREPFRPNAKVDREMAKKHLQDMMSYGKELKAPPKPLKKKVPDNTKFLNRYDELQQEIEDRQKWFSEMEELGEGDKYRLIIQQQIEARLREMENLRPGHATRRTHTQRSNA